MSKQSNPVLMLKYLKIDQDTLISVPTAVNYIFKLPQTHQLVNKGLECFGLCSTCAAMISKLYKFHKQLEQLTHLESVIGNLMSSYCQHGKSGRLYQFPNPKPSSVSLAGEPKLPLHNAKPDSEQLPIITKVVSVSAGASSSKVKVSAETGASSASVLNPKSSHEPCHPADDSPDSLVKRKTVKIENVQGLPQGSSFHSDDDDEDPSLDEPLSEVRNPDQSHGSKDSRSKENDRQNTDDSAEPEIKKAKRSGSGRRSSKKRNSVVERAALRLKKRAQQTRKIEQSVETATIEHPPCPICGKVLRNKRSDWLEVHINRNHKPFDPRFICTICGKPSTNRVFMVIHERTHLNAAERAQVEGELGIQTSFLCPECGKILARENYLKEHVRRVHGDLSARRIRCEEPGCDFSSLDKKTLKRHRHRVHDLSSTPLFRCKQCDQGFRVYVQLKDHEMLECDASNRPFVCQYCPRRFKLKQALVVHLHDVHKLSPAEARQNVYPALDYCPDWVGKKRREKDKKRRRGRPPINESPQLD